MVQLTDSKASWGTTNGSDHVGASAVVMAVAVVVVASTARGMGG